jgi:hypothetical protein
MKSLQALRHSANVLLFALFPLLTGCSWNGQLPAKLENAPAYPVIAAVHGVRRATTSDDLKSTTTTYVDLNPVPRNRTNGVSWLIQIEPLPETAKVEEFYFLPGPARWPPLGTFPLRDISIDQKASWTQTLAPKGTKYLSGGWGMYPDDPLGEYRLAVFIDGKRALDFKFTVIDDPTAKWIAADYPYKYQPADSKVKGKY